MSDETRKTKRGFGSMDPARQREIASRGGSSVPAASRSFSRDPELAREAGRKGGQCVKPSNRAYSRDPELASEAGRRGGFARQAALRQARETSNTNKDKA